MDQRTFSPILLVLVSIVLLALSILGIALWNALQSSPGTEFNLARHRWETSSIVHYRMAVNYSGKYALCYYDIEVQGDRVVHIITIRCLSNAEPKILTIDGLFENFEQYAAQKVCIPTGCSCGGRLVVSGTFDPTLGYPQSITTVFHRSWLDELLKGKLGGQPCQRMHPLIEKFEVVKVAILP